MNKKNSKSGFTLAELLIVIAIIAVLVAVSIPVFTNQLEKAREATDVANIRAAYAAIMLQAMEDPGVEKLERDPGDHTDELLTYRCPVELKQKIPGWQNEECREALLELFKEDAELKDKIDDLTIGIVSVAWIPSEVTGQEDGVGMIILE